MHLPRVGSWSVLLLLGLSFAEADAQQPAAEEASGPKLTKPPKLLHFVEAEYPAEEKAAGITASVVLSIEISEEGKVQNVTVVQSAGPAFDAAAVAAAKQFVFEPAEIDHRPAPVKITYRYDFTTKEEIVQLGPQLNFEGVVLDRFSKSPVPEVTVTIKDLDISTVTDEQGQFGFIDIPPGVHRVELSGATLVRVGTDEEFVRGKKKTVRYFAEQKEEGVDEEQVVRAPRIRKEAVETTIRTEEARRVPGTQGDTLKVVQNLPGVARSAFGSGALIVWGSAPRDTRVNLDGVEIPSLYHLGGLRSTVDSDLVRSIDLTPGAYGAEYGRGLGGLVRVESRALPSEGTHGYVAADALDASALVSTTVGPKLRFGIAGRYSYLDRLLPLVTSTDIGDFFPIPRYQGLQFKASLGLRPDEELSALGIFSRDDLTRTVPSADPAQVRSERLNTWFYRALLRYSRILPDGASLAVTPSFGVDHNRTTTHFGPVPTELEITTTRIGLRSSYRRRVASFATVSLGSDFLSSPSNVSRAGSLNLPAREGDIFVFGQPPSDDVAADQWSSHIADVGTYCYFELQSGRWTLTPGVRLDAMLIEGSRLTPRIGLTPSIGFSRLEWTFDPRLSLTYQLSRRISLSASGGVYHQAPDAEDLSAVFGNPSLGLERAIHASGDVGFKLTGTLTAQLVGFYKYYDGLVARSPLITPPLAGALTQLGTGSSYGGQLLLRQELANNFFGWVSYAYSRSKRQDAPSRPIRLFDFDQTHVLSLVGSYEFRGWTLGGRFRYASGFPRTPVVGSFFDARDDLYQPVFGAQNAIRIPDFYQLDLRLERSVVIGQTSLNLFVDVQNVTARKNPEEIAYNYNFKERQYITGLPTLAVFGARLGF